MKFIRQILRKIAPPYNYLLTKSVKGCKTCLDIGCGDNSRIRFFQGIKYSEGVDSFLPSIERSKIKKIHNKYHHINIMALENHFKKNSFDCVIALEVIEHLKKENGLKLLKMMEKIAKKKVIISTPNGFLPQGEYDNNICQKHLSGWTVKEMQNKNYKIIGFNGLKQLRKEYSRIKFKPQFFWTIISHITQIYTKNHPKKAFQLLCIKKFKS